MRKLSHHEKIILEILRANPEKALSSEDIMGRNFADLGKSPYLDTEKGLALHPQAAAMLYAIDAALDGLLKFGVIVKQGDKFTTTQGSRA